MPEWPVMNIFTAILLPAVVAIIMIAMGLALQLRDFTEVARAPKAVALGIGLQILVLPVLGLAVISAWPMAPELAVGLMIIAACPGGPMSNLLTHLAHGDTALSISLTALVSLISIFSLPLIVGAALPHLLGEAAPPMPLGGTILALSAMTLLPLAIGMTLRAQVPALACRVEPVARRAATGVFILFIIAAVIREWALVRDHLPSLAGPVMLLNLAAMSVAYLLARGSRQPPGRSVALTIECGIQNGSLAMFVGATLLGSEMMMLPGAAYGLLMFPTALLFVGMVLRGERAAARIAAKSEGV